MPDQSEIPQINTSTSDPQSSEQGSSELISKISFSGDSKEASNGVSKQVKPISKRKQRVKKALPIVLAVALVIILLMFISAFSFYKRAMAVKDSMDMLTVAMQHKNIDELKTELDNTQDAVTKLDRSYSFVSWAKLFPFLGVYVNDAGHVINAAEHGLEAADIVIEAMEPYADLIGFANGEGDQEPETGEKTAKDRIDIVVNSLPSLLPQLDSLSEKLVLINDELSYIDPEQYPEELRGNQVRSNIVKGLDIVDQTTHFVTQGRPLLEKAPGLLGLEEPRTYLVLFQNDKELRPTGGFLTAYSIMTVDKANFNPVSSDDIYNLDAKYKPAVRAPEPIINYIKGPYILNKNVRLRDMNWSPDFSESMNLLVEEATGIGIDDIDGIISVDTQVLVNLLDVLGPIGVPGFGNFSTEIVPECNCPQVIYELESFADVEGPVIWDPVTGEIIQSPPNSDNRKKIIGPLMNSVMVNAMGQPKEKLPDLVEAALKSLTEKHVLFYLFNEEEQAAAEAFGVAGTIKEYDGDYLHINDANLGGRKSNLYVTQEVNQEVDVAKDGTVTKTVTITYNNPEKYDGWLNSVLPNWVRIYVPQGSELIDISGVEDKADPYDEFGKTVYAGYFELRPQGVAKVTVTYKLPFKVDDEYNLLIQKQPGTDSPLHSVSLGKKQEEFFLRTDEEVNFSI